MVTHGVNDSQNDSVYTFGGGESERPASQVAIAGKIEKADDLQEITEIQHEMANLELNSQTNESNKENINPFNLN